MWTHQLRHLLWRSVLDTPTLLSSNWFAVGFSLLLFVAPQLRGLAKHGWKQALKEWKENFGFGALVLLVGWLGVFLVSMSQHIYRDHQDLAGQNESRIQQLKVVARERDEWKDKYEQLKQLKPKETIRIVQGTAKEPTLRALGRPMGNDEGGLIVTEYTITSDVYIPPPLFIEMDFDNPVMIAGVEPLPHPAVTLGGGSRWNGTHAYATVPNSGIGPDLSWLVKIKSKGPIVLVKPPVPRKKL